MTDANRRPRQKLLAQFLSYVAVGGTAFVVDFGVLYFLTEHLGVHYLGSATAGFLTGLVVNYLLCIVLIFDFRAIDKAAHEFGLFAVIGIAGLLLNNSLLWLLTELAGFHYLASKLVAAALVLIFNFTLRRQLLFSDNRLARRLGGRKFAETR
ncbi:GtrA family protein [Azospira restricta]|uniref:GtrA family protein n=1 Tax=Azospira restricta TaxID=404405 RepID=A0A974SNJ4_9RHOO|nr:GtrA family protein [Azospira restricta]QRJ63594.1 GtrA family protein [Azospira restricta]